MKVPSRASAIVMVLLASGCASTDQHSASSGTASAQSGRSVDTATIPQSDWRMFSLELFGGNQQSVPLPELHPIARRSVVYRNAYAPSELTLPVLPRSRTPPAYPYDLFANRIGGTVLMSLLVRSDGTVGQADILEATNQLFAAAAERVVGSWLFVPGEKNGKAVPSVMIVPIVFRASDRSLGPTFRGKLDVSPTTEFWRH